MALARAWRRRLYASVGVAVVVPGALLLSLGLLALGGGSLSLSSLGQVVSGPSAPAVAPVALGGGGTGRTLNGGGGAAGLAATALPAVANLPSSSAGSGSATGGGPAGTGGHGGAGGSGGGGSVGGSGGGGTGSGGNGGSGGGGHGGGSGHPTVIDKVVGAVTPVTSTLPSPAGTIVTGVVRSAGSVGDQVLKKLPVR